MVTLSRESFPVSKIGIHEIIPDSELSHVAHAYIDRDEAMRATIVRLEARLLSSQETEVRAHAHVKAETVQSVWDAICVYWLAPLFALLFDKTGWNWFLQHEVWAAMHVDFVEDSDSETKYVTMNWCPHIAVPDNKMHIDFLRTEFE